MMKHLALAVCEGRHEIPNATDGAIFPQEVENPFDFPALVEIVKGKLDSCTSLDLYITGLTPCTLAVVNYCIAYQIPLTCWHYNRETRKYVPQEMGTSLNKEVRRCTHCGKQMWVGYCIGNGDEYYCSDECLYANYSKQEYNEMYKSDCAYWTEWED